jgi:MFS family permease
MQLIVPDIMSEARGFPVAGYAVALVVGFLLWLLGWWGHRFWIVLFTTVVGGIVGLSLVRTTGVQPFVAGLLLAIAAGTLALALSRLVAFAAGGVAAWVVVRGVAPACDEPLLCFLSGGLAGLYLFRAWTMALTSLGGGLIMVYAGLALGDRLGKLNAMDWSQHRVLLLNWLCGSLAVVGWVTQFVMERLRVHRERQHAEQLEYKEAEKELKERFKRRAAGRHWWPWGKPGGDKEKDKKAA